jgi:hypothetical protein
MGVFADVLWVLLVSVVVLAVGEWALGVVPESEPGSEAGFFLPVVGIGIAVLALAYLLSRADGSGRR